MSSTLTKMQRYQARREAGTTAENGTCKTCLQVLPASEFRRNWHRPSGLDYNCHGCVSHINRLARFGLTPEQYDDMLLGQGGLCAICDKPETTLSKNGRPKALAVDHDHETGDIRGLLCGNCNKGLGNLGDSVETLMAAAAYLIERSGLGEVDREDG